MLTPGLHDQHAAPPGSVPAPGAVLSHAAQSVGLPRVGHTAVLPHPAASAPLLHLPGAVVDRIAAQGWLDSPWPGAVLTALFLGGAVLAVHAVLRRRGALHITTAVAGTVVAALLASLAFVNAFAGYVPDTVAAERMLGLQAGGGTGSRRPGPAGTVRAYILGAAALKVPPSPVWVYLPPGYGAPGNAARRYPVVYLLHGYPGRSVDWFSGGRVDVTMDTLVDSGAMPPAIVVAPDMNGGALFRDTEGLNVADGPQVQTYLTATVPAWVDATFRSIPTPQARVIGGMSAGGYVALNLGLRYQSVFGGIIAQEPYGDPGRSVLPELHGDLAAYAAQSPSAYLRRLRFVRPEPTFIDVGGLANPNGPRHLAALLRSRHQPVYFRTEPGQKHTWTEARVGIAYGLVWVADQLGWIGSQSTMDTKGVARPT